MTLLKPGEQPGGSVNLSTIFDGVSRSVKSLLIKSWIMVEMEIRKLRHDYSELLTRVVQPLLWLTVFGQAMSRTRAIPTGNFTYLQFMTPGILAQSVIFTAIFYGIAIIWERDLGLVQKFLITPTPRIALMIGKMAAAGIRGICQAVMVTIVTFIMGIHLHLTILGGCGVILTIMLGGGFFAGLSLIIASLVKTRERFMGIGQLLTMPLFFASNAIYPIKIMPHWLQIVATINPLSYMVDALRSLLLTGNSPALPLDFAVLAIAALLVALIGAERYSKIVI